MYPRYTVESSCSVGTQVVITSKYSFQLKTVVLCTRSMSIDYLLSFTCKNRVVFLFVSFFFVRWFARANCLYLIKCISFYCNHGFSSMPKFGTNHDANMQSYRSRCSHILIDILDANRFRCLGFCKHLPFSLALPWQTRST